MSLKVVELFAGIGSWRKALQNLEIDHEIVLAVENDKYALAGYNAIHNTNFESIDITQLDEKDVPDCDMVVYSPPCQSFSIAGRQLGFEDKRGVLFFDALRVIKDKRPMFALMENVKGLTQPRFKNEFHTMLNELETLGYKNHWKVLNSLDYGVPQNRERVFVVSVREDVDADFDFPDALPLTNQIGSFLEEDARLPILHNIYGGFNEKVAREFGEYSPTIRTSSGGGHVPSVVLNVKVEDINTAHDKLQCIRDQNPNKKGYGLVVKSDKGYKLVGKDTLLDKTKHYHFIRELSNLEAFRLMGFEHKDYILAKRALNDTFYNGRNRSNTRLKSMSGNAIVVDVCEAIFRELL